MTKIASKKAEKHSLTGLEMSLHQAFGIWKHREDIFPGIVKTKGVCGGSACIVRTRIPVWSVIEWQQMGCSNTKILKIYPTLTASDLVSAENYYKHNQEEIEQAIRTNLEA